MSGVWGPWALSGLSCLCGPQWLGTMSAPSGRIIAMEGAIVGGYILALPTTASVSASILDVALFLTASCRC